MYVQYICMYRYGYVLKCSQGSTVCNVCMYVYLYLYFSVLIFFLKVKVLHHHDDLHPCEIYHNLHSADILLTSHGFQNTG